MGKESEDYARKSAEFKRWLALYFIEKGNWKLADKAIEEFGHDATPKQTMEFAEVCSDREREERTQYRVGLTAKEKKKITHMKVADMIDEGKAEELYDNGYITDIRTRNWKDESNRITVTKKLVEVLNKDPRDLTRGDFEKNGLSALMPFCKNSPYKAVKETFPELDIKQWEMIQTPHGFYKKKENRIVAVKWLVKKLKKDPGDIIQREFNNNRLAGLIQVYYNGSPHEAVKEAFPEMDIKPWEMKVTPNGFYHEKENRVAAVKWLVEKLGIDPRNLTREYFHSNRLDGLFTNYYNTSPYEAVKEAFPEMDIKAWEMKMTPLRFFNKKENRVAAVKWLVEKLKKDPRDLTVEDFRSNRLVGLLNEYYNGSPYDALKEAGLVSKADEKYMRSPMHTRKIQDAPPSKEAREAAKKIERNAEKSGPKGKIARKTFC